MCSSPSSGQLETQEPPRLSVAGAVRFSGGGRFDAARVEPSVQVRASIGDSAADFEESRTLALAAPHSERAFGGNGTHGRVGRTIELVGIEQGALLEYGEARLHPGPNSGVATITGIGVPMFLMRANRLVNALKAQPSLHRRPSSQPSLPRLARAHRGLDCPRPGRICRPSPLSCVLAGRAGHACQRRPPRRWS